jgi:molybdopterin/thiamine biosynthesis adenylyltransferase
MALTSEQITRYSRHILLPEVGMKGQETLRQASVAIVGLGGLGCPAALYLAAAGVGRLGLIDGDKAELSNLQRQILHRQADIGRSKVESAAEKIGAMDPSLRLDLHPLRLEAPIVLGLLEGYDLVLEGTDNFGSKFLVNDACVSLGIPLVQAGILRFEGQLMSILPGSSACYRCIFENAPGPEAVPNCSEAGVLGAVAGVLGSLMANEALKILLGLGQPLYDRMLSFDAKRSFFREAPLRRNPSCPSCSRAGSRFQPLAETGLQPQCDA